MALSFGPPARAPSPAAPTHFGRGINLALGHGVAGAMDTQIFGRSDSKEVGSDWFNEFEAWWEQHGYYPPQAGQNGEQGDVTLDLVIRKDGTVQSVKLAEGSGSQWLDMAALAVFRDAHLPSLSSDDAATVPLHLTIHYVIVQH
jgi:TonB family protein